MLASKVLRDMPAAQMVAWIYKDADEIPEYMDLIPTREPNWLDMETNIGLPKNPDSDTDNAEEQDRRERAAYQRGYNAGKTGGRR